MLKTIQRDSLLFCKSHNPNYSMFKTKTHNAYIIIMINKESYIKKKSHNDSIKNHHDSRRLPMLKNSQSYAIIRKNEVLSL